MHDLSFPFILLSIQIGVLSLLILAAITEAKKKIIKAIKASGKPPTTPE